MYNVIEIINGVLSSFIYWDEKEAKKELIAKIKAHLYWNEISEEVAGLDKKEILKDKKFSFEDYSIQLVEPESDYTIIEGMENSEIVEYLRDTGDIKEIGFWLDKHDIYEMLKNNTEVYVLQPTNIIEELKAKELAEKFPNV